MRSKIASDDTSRSQGRVQPQQGYSSLMTKPKDAVNRSISRNKSRAEEPPAKNMNESDILLSPAELELMEKEEEKNRKNGTIYKNSVKLLNVDDCDTGARTL